MNRNPSNRKPGKKNLRSPKPAPYSRPPTGSKHRKEALGKLQVVKGIEIRGPANVPIGSEKLIGVKNSRQEVVFAIDRLEKISPLDAAVLNNLGCAYALLNMDVEAKEALQKAIDLSTDIDATKQIATDNLAIMDTILLIDAQQ